MLLKIYISIVLLTLSFISYSQNDVIILRNGTEITAKVEEVGTAEIKYRKASNINGPVYTADISTVFMIKYENGEKDVFENYNPSSKTKTTTAVLPEWDIDPYDGRESVDTNAREFTKGELWTERNLIYYGVDFTSVRLIGSASFNDSQTIVEKYFGGINTLLESYN